MEQDQPQFTKSSNNSSSSSSDKNNNTNTTRGPNTNFVQQVPQLPSQRPKRQFHEILPSSVPPSAARDSQFTHSASRPNTNRSSSSNFTHLISRSRQRMSYPMFSPQPGPSSPFNSGSGGGGGANSGSAAQQAGNSPPSKRLRGDSVSSPVTTPNLNFLLGSQRHTPGSIEQNVSYTRSFSTGSHSGAGKGNPYSQSRGSSHLSPQPLQPQTPGASHESSNISQQASQLQQESQKHRSTEIQHGDSDEDARFLRLAREALVATATGVNPSGTVDPTISDLLQRLQYAASPHGNPIKRGSKIKANSKGQLNISGFYQQFPNLSNDIFMENGEGSSTEDKSHHPSTNSEGWNFLIGEPITFKTAGTSYNKEEDVDAEDKPTLRSQSTTSLSDDASVNPSRKDSVASIGDDPSRKFLCTKCSMSFRRSSDLKRHEKQHLTIPPNICELCGKGFARKDALKRHMGTLTCKRNADKKLYIDNLNYLREHRGNRPGGSASRTSGFESGSGGNFDHYHLNEDDESDG
ncbi:uncharacterized protein RJT20DRAFT_134467 [Scheffersomyces xylosifermentans]|uniref:uncharacterized protein n=1 Tax=Scheffersomyces xylosifermentans TaxID=1304137 RepID=UPI00315CEAA0